VTPRALLTAFVALVLIAAAGFYVDLRYFVAHSFGSGVPSAAPFALLFVLAAATGLRGLGRRLGFTRRELLTVYAIVLVGAPVLSHGVLGWMVPHSAYQQYTARALPDWERTFLHLVPPFFTPTDPIAVEDFFQGRAGVPWRLWWVPLAAWSSFLLGLVVASVCLASLLQRQWITNERLSFPLAQIPLQSVSQGAGNGSRARLPLSWVFWVGIGLSFGINFVNSLSGRFPAIPAIPLGPVAIMQWQKVGPLAGLGEIDLVLWPWLIAVAYLIPKDLSFSCWFFWIVRVALTVAAIAAGAFPQRPEEWFSSTFPAPNYQGTGAVLALTAWTLWIGRRHLGHALRIAFSRKSGRADAEEPIPYRWALFGFVGATVWLVYFCWLSGSRVFVGAALIGLILTFYVMWARLRAETGMGFIPFPLNVNDVMVVPFGSGVFRPQEIVMILSARWSYFPGFGQSLEVVPSNALESMKIADSAGIGQRRLLYAMAAGFLVSLAVGLYIIMTGMYWYGFYGLRASTPNFWLESQARLDGSRIFNHLTNPSSFNLNGTIAMASGGAAAIALGLMRLRFWWWPFHPIGYLAANVWGMHWNYMPFFLGWLAKTLVIRYGGLRLYRQTVPLAIGLIGGDLLDQVLWAMVALATRGTF